MASYKNSFQTTYILKKFAARENVKKKLLDADERIVSVHL